MGTLSTAIPSQLGAVAPDLDSGMRVDQEQIRSYLIGTTSAFFGLGGFTSL